MFIVWGKKKVSRKAGFVADFCPMCRCARTFSLQRIGMAGHLYYITVSEGELMGFERTCDECGTRYSANPEHYQSISKKRGSLDALIASTFPRLKEAWAERLALEVQVRTASALLPPEQRAWLVREPFLLASPDVEARYASTHLDKEVGFALAGAIALCMVLPAMVRWVSPDDGEPAVLTALVVGVMLVIWQMTQVNRRYLRRQVIPALARALKPLRPTDAELTVALAELKSHGHKIGSKVTVADMSAQLNERPGVAGARLAGEN